MAFIYDLADTWNASGTVFTGIKLNVTDSASAAGSLLMDLQVGGVSRFRAVKDGSIELRTAGGVRTLFSSPSVGGGEARVGVSGSFTLSAGNADAGSSPDIFLARDAANTLAQRNGGNPQAFNLYNTYTDASNYERGFMRWSSNVLQIGSDKLGTGFLARSIDFQTDGTTRMSISNTGTVVIPNTGFTVLGSFAVTNAYNAVLWNGGAFGWSSISSAGVGSTPDTAFVRAAANIIRVTNGSTGGGAMQLTEMTAPAAPAADNVRIYAEDDGAGKTRLMARFATGAAVQIAIEP